MAEVAPGSDPAAVEREGIPVPDDQVTWQMRANAIGSPDRAGAGVLQTSEAAVSDRVEVIAEQAGEAVVAQGVELSLPPVQEGNGLSAFDQQKIRESVDKNITLTQMYGSQYVSSSTEKQ